jgi:hypothetical protein
VRGAARERPGGTWQIGGLATAPSLFPSPNRGEILQPRSQRSEGLGSAAPFPLSQKPHSGRDKSASASNRDLGTQLAPAVSALQALVALYGFSNPGLRCAPTWAIESGPFRAFKRQLLFARRAWSGEIHDPRVWVPRPRLGVGVPD